MINGCLTFYGPEKDENDFPNPYYIYSIFEEDSDINGHRHCIVHVSAISDATPLPPDDITKIEVDDVQPEDAVEIAINSILTFIQDKNLKHFYSIK